MRLGVLALVVLAAARCGGGTKALPHSGPVTWATAQQLILDCHVTGGEVLHSRRVALVLDNGARVTTRERGINDIFTVFRKADPHCPGPKTFAEE